MKKQPTRTDFIELNHTIFNVCRNHGETTEEAEHNVSTYSYAIYRGLITFESVIKKFLERIQRIDSSNETKNKS